VSIEVIDHTADVRVHVRAASMDELFREALRGTIALLRPVRGAPVAEREIIVNAPDRTALLVDFLNEALSSAHARREAYDDVLFFDLSETHLQARLRGVAAVSFGNDVKAVTYHQADVHRDESGLWQTMLVVDI
jgi:protein archease